MKALITSIGPMGPYNAIQLMGDHYLCDGIVLPLSVLGEVQEANAEDIQWPAPPVSPRAVPQKITRRQARQQLLLAGLLDNVEPMIEAIADPTERRLALIEWQDSQDFERNRPLLIAIGTALGLSSEELDNLFIEASAL